MNKAAIVTGASSGIGLAISRVLCELNYDVYGFGRDFEREETAQFVQSTKTFHPVIGDLLETQKVCDKVKQITGEARVEVLVNAAGFGLFGTFTEMDMDRQLDIIDLNARALTAMCYMSLPYMSQGSRIYNMGSMSSWQPVPYINVYGASKAYVLSFSRALGVEVKGRGIKVMAVCPGWITTEFFDHAVHDDTISYFNRYYPPEQVIEKALKDMKKGKSASVLGFPERVQVQLVKHLPTSFVMKTWCKQQGK